MDQNLLPEHYKLSHYINNRDHHFKSRKCSTLPIQRRKRHFSTRGNLGYLLGTLQEQLLILLLLSPWFVSYLVVMIFFVHCSMFEFMVHMFLYLPSPLVHNQNSQLTKRGSTCSMDKFAGYVNDKMFCDKNT